MHEILLQWGDRFRLGLPEVDEQHRALVEALNGLAAALGRGEPMAALVAILDQLYLDTREHFAAEERLMAETGYPRLGEHRREHVMLLAELKTFIHAVRKGAEPLDARALAALQKWLIAHILGSDKAFVVVVRQREGA